MVRDLNGDNLLDIIVVHNDTKSVDIFLGKEEGFQWETKYSTDNPYSDSASDGDTTEVVDYSHQMRWRRQYGQGICQNYNPWTSQYLYVGRYLAMADLNNDTYLDVTVDYRFNSTIGIYFGLEQRWNLGYDLCRKGK